VDEAGGPKISRWRASGVPALFTDEQFDAMIGHLKMTMDKNGVPADARRDLT
jgi:truncated hemoglobin YjbI